MKTIQSSDDDPDDKDNDALNFSGEVIRIFGGISTKIMAAEL